MVWPAIVHRGWVYCFSALPARQALGKQKRGGFAIVHRNSLPGLRLFIRARIKKLDVLARGPSFIFCYSLPVGNRVCDCSSELGLLLDVLARGSGDPRQVRQGHGKQRGWVCDCSSEFTTGSAIVHRGSDKNLMSSPEARIFLCYSIPVENQVCDGSSGLGFIDVLARGSGLGTRITSEYSELPVGGFHAAG
jgi:hypothetical protein